MFLGAVTALYPELLWGSFSETKATLGKYSDLFFVTKTFRQMRHPGQGKKTSWLACESSSIGCFSGLGISNSLLHS